MLHSLKISQEKSHITGWKFKSEKAPKEQDNFTSSFRNNKVL